MTDFKDKSIAIIGGATKSGTTSLFKYLERHPKVCCSNLKETRFFLDKSYPLKAQAYLEDAGLEKYLDYFPCDKPILLEATPDYLFSPGTPARVQKALGVENVRWLFILRDPIQRLLSWYRFGKQVGQIEADQTLSGYIHSQLNATTPPDIQAYRALEQGNYKRYLQPYLELFGAERVMVIDFNTLAQDPAGTVQQVCTFLGLDYSEFIDYDFFIYNESIHVRDFKLQQVYYQWSEKLYLKVYDKSFIRKALHWLRDTIINPIYTFINGDPDPVQEDLDPELRGKLREYYREYYA